MSAKHTPGPWSTWTNDTGINGFGNPKNPSGRAFNKEDAEFIIQAVNSHDELLEALKRLREAFYVKGDSKSLREAFEGTKELVAKGEHTEFNPAFHQTLA